jgi:hypothetical protein
MVQAERAPEIVLRKVRMQRSAFMKTIAPSLAKETL